MGTIRVSSPTMRMMLRYFHAYRQIFLYAVLFLAGILTGALFLKSADTQTLQSLSTLIGHFAVRRGEQNILTTFVSSFTSTALMLAILFVCGFCAVAQPVIVLLPFFRGLGFGYQAGYLYAQNGFLGVGYVALVLLPNMLLSTLILIYGCGEAFSMSTAYYRSTKQEGGSHLIQPKAYCVKFMLLLFLSLASALIDALCNALFSGLFPMI
ncbi:stage II sporulation protein M [Clostridiaceae bacterium NSJ-31]|uniref:Stage II sporulation protein M n=1 Tax=Ligaoa zhengdingensis TaxID=2763658 RepID=A0A926DVP5_9FIRM|nr:stage II sporulation protein M [Ligaoa zhengdingensis]MBC8545581.1 stage II sporulation protein M [Ligaoa zhengdingensis]